jgi:hypothetical protein
MGYGEDSLAGTGLTPRRVAAGCRQDSVVSGTGLSPRGLTPGSRQHGGINAELFIETTISVTWAIGWACRSSKQNRVGSR